MRGRPAERGYRTITSSAVPLNLEDLTLDRAGGGHSAASAAALLAAGDSQQLEDAEGGTAEPDGGGSRPASRAGSMQDVGAAAAGCGSESEGGGLTGEQQEGRGLVVPRCALTLRPNLAPQTLRTNPVPPPTA